MIELFLSVIPVGPRASRLEDQWFALQIAVARDPSAPTDPLPLPWVPAGRGGVDFGLDADDSCALMVKPAGGPAVEVRLHFGGAELREPHFGDPILAAVKSWFSEKTHDAQAKVGVIDRKIERVPLAPQLTYLATLPGNIPQALRVLGYFKVPATVGAQFTVTPASVNGIPANPEPAPEAPAVRDAPRRMRWSYQNNDVVAQVDAVDVRAQAGRALRFDDEPEPNDAFDLDSYWLEPTADAETGRLRARIEAATDVLARLIDFRVWLQATHPDQPEETRQTLEKLMFTSVGHYAFPTLNEALWAQVDSSNMPNVAQAARALLAKLAGPTGMAAWSTVLARAVGGEPTAVAIEGSARNRVGDAVLVNRIAYHFFEQAVAEANDPTATAQFQRATKDVAAAIDALGGSARVPGAARTWREQVNALAHDIAARGGSLADAAKAELRAWLSTRFDVLHAQPPHPPLPAPPLLADWNAYVDEYLTKLFSAGGQPSRAVAGRHDGITVAFGRVEPRKDGRDDWAGLAGVGLVLRDVTAAGRWRIATAGVLALERGVVSGLAAIVPNRVPFREGVRFPVLSYENWSPVARSPIADALGEIATSTMGFSVNPLGGRYRWLAVTDQSAPPGPTDAEHHAQDRLKLTRLRYGHEYAVGAFMIDVGHGLPANLSLADKPWMVDLSKMEDAAWAPGHVETIRYLRHARVEDVRIGAGSSGKHEPWPPIPKDVLPLSADIGALNPDSDGRTPLGPVLLGAEGFSFTIAPPTVGIDVFERSVDTAALHDAYLWYLRALQRVNETKDAEASAPTFDDPLFKDFVIRLEHYELPRGWVLDDEKAVAATGAPHSPPKPFAVRVDAIAKIEVESSTIHVSSRGVSRVSISARLDGDAVRSQLARESMPFAVPGQGDVVLPPSRIVFEVPSSVLPSAEELFAAMKVTIEDEARAVNIRLDTTQGQNFDNVGAVDLLRQPWRWRGLPLPRTSAGKPLPVGATIDEIEQWEQRAFAGFEDAYDSLVIPAGPLAYDGTSTDILVRRDRIPDDRSAWVRYSVRIRSRYQGLFPALSPVVARAGGSSWKRAYARYVGRGVSRPVVQAIVPLTRGDESGVASLLVVLDETAFTQAGISESLEAKIDSVESPANRENHYRELGRDPIIQVEPSSPVAGALSVPVTGPFGHTHDDEGVRFPAFGASSYILHPPAGARPWDFARIRLRRVHEEGAPERPSDWTSGHWVQFLPGSEYGSNYRVETDDVVNISFDDPHGTFAVLQASKRFAYVALVTKKTTDFAGVEGEKYVSIHLCQSKIADKRVTLSFAFGPTESTVTHRVRVIEVQLGPETQASQLFDVMTVTSTTGKTNPAVKFWAGLAPADGSEATHRITRISGPSDFSPPSHALTALMLEATNRDLAPTRAKTVNLSRRGTRWYASVDGGAEFFVGAETTYGNRRGLWNVPRSELPGDVRYSRADFPQFGFWSTFIEPTARCESDRFFDCINTYDRAAFTFGFMQFAAHVPDGDFVVYLRKLLATSSAADYFPDLTLRDGRIAKRKADGSLLQLESKDSSAGLMAYLNPTAESIDEAEVTNAAKLAHWIRTDADHRLLIVDLAISLQRQSMQRYAKQYALGGVADFLCLVIADIRHQGRGGEQASAKIKAALASGNPFESLLAIGAEQFTDRVKTLRRSIEQLQQEGALGARVYDVNTGDFVPRR